MGTDLFIVASRLAGHAITSVVPPDCRRPVSEPPPARADGAHVVLDPGPWEPRDRCAHFLPSMSAPGAPAHSVRFELRVRRAGAWSGWVAGAGLGPAAFPPMGGAVEGLRSDVDVFVAPDAAEAVHLRVRIPASDAGVLAAPWLVTLSAGDGRPPATDAPADGPPVDLAVPPLSQREADAAIAMRVCSPTSVAMVLAYWGRPSSIAAVAADAFHPALDLYGVWPAAIRAAASRGVAGYLLRFPGWPAAAWCLARGLPLVASVRYREGELAGAAVPATSGHLLVLRGWDGEDILVNDPAGTPGEVVRRYRRRELLPAWLGHGGVGYVLFDPAAARG